MDRAEMPPSGAASRLSPAAQALLEERLKRRSAGSAPRQGIPRRAEPGPAPLSFAQERIWFLARLAPDSPAYNIARAFVLRGPLDREALARSLHEIARRHEALRTTFAATGALLVQRISAEPDVALAAVDLVGLRGVEAEMERLALSEAERPFDLERGPLLRTVLLRTGPEEHTLLLTIHHIVADGWSMDVLFRELGALYRGMALPELPVQYADFAVWQRGRLQGAHLDRLLAYWRARLGGAPPVLELPSDRPRPGVRTWAGGLRTFDLAVPAAAVRAAGAAQGASPFIVLLAAFFAILRRTTGRDDLVAGTPVAGRDRSELEDLIGLFVNTLVLRADLGGDPTFEEVLRRTRQATLGAYNHQEMPFDKLVEVLAPERDLSSTPLFQVLFALENTGRSRLELPGLAVIPRQVWSGTAKFDLSFTLVEDGEGLSATLVYDREIFDPSTLARLAGHFGTLLAGAAAAPGRRLSELPLLSAAESQQLLREWNDTAAPYPEGPCLHELIAAQAKRSPERVAVVFEGESLTYAELEAAAGRLAHGLAGLGVGPDVPVAICAERSLEMVVGLLAILKSGGAYLPLDPAYPADRLAYMLEDSRVPVLLAQSRLLERLPDPGAAVLLLDGTAAVETSTAPFTCALPGSSNLAYVIYTSGSTGRPKGTMNSHGGIVNRLLWMQERFGLTPDDAVLQKTPFSFDVSVWELFWPLLAGARLVMALPGGHQDPSYLVDTIAGEGITTLHFVPSMLQAFVEAPGVERCTSLTRVVCSGEALPAELERRFYARMPAGAALYNLYGPTEAAVDVTWWACEREGLRAAVPIGIPVANTRIHLLDRHLRPVPAGVPGELYIGGVQVGRGYLGRPGLTAERFVPDPFEPGARLYRSGDLARHLPAGEIEFLGRIDHQVKIRGFRIELGEIEAALLAHPEVREAVVVAREEGGGDKRLVAYVAPGLPSDLRAHLQRSLPDYMVPSAFVGMESLPLTPNGKVDRKSLPAPGREERADEEEPRTPLEEILAEIWSVVLRLERVGVRANFFDLGGHSLLATQVVSRVREVCGVELALRRLFELPTVEGLARQVEAARRGGEAPQAPPIVPVARGAEAPASFAQERLWFLEQMDGGGSAYNLPMVLRLRGRLDAVALEAALSEVSRRHEVLRTSFRSVVLGVVQVIAPAGPLALSTVDLRELAGGEAEARRLGLEEATRPFDVGRGPLLRALLLRLDEEEHALVLAMHHIVSDGWSMGVLVRELTALYEGKSLPELPVQYADFAVWQRRWLQGEVLAELLGWWRERLAGAPALLELPLDRPRPAVQTSRGGRLSFSLGEAVSRGLRELARRHGATPFMASLAALQTLLARYSGGEDVPVGSPIANRNRSETEGLIGFFVNTLVLRGDLRDEPGFADLLGRAREMTLGAYAHQDLPFEKLVEELRPERALSHSPLFQVLLVFQNTLVAPPRSSGLEVEITELAAEEQGAKFDLTLALGEGSEGLRGQLAYNRDLFDAATAERMLGHFQTLLAGAVSEPQRPVWELELLSEAERGQLLTGWNDTARGLCLHEAFAAQAARTPEARAIASLKGGEGLTYGELERRSNKLANRLLRLGVGPEVRVGIALERSPAMVVALLAVLKAGGAYVPLDPAYPRERLAFILADADSPVLLSERKVLERLPPFSGAALLLDEDAAESDEAPVSGVTPGNLAYLIYTSGSTGRPKGVAIEHRSASALLDWARSAFPPEDLAGVLASTSITFDLSVFELFLPLSTGGTVVLAENALELAQAAAEEVRLVNTVPSAMAALVRDGALPSSVRTVNLAGEPLKRALVERIYAVPGIERVFNLYGPSEDTTYSTWVLVPRGEEREPTIGVPIANTRAYVLDARLSLLPVGAPGELLLGGEGLARGYLNRPDLTAERFIPDPFGGPGERLYRTGDLVRRRADGELEFLGRLDHQVKIRGFRIELGEIEAALAALPAVREAVVVALDGGSVLDRRLVAYVVASGGGELSPAALRESLKEKLPDYMVPAAFVALPSLPLSPNGKVDRRALPAPEAAVFAGAAGERPFVAPRTELERLLAGLWREHLGAAAPAEVGVRDDFFALGGNSLGGALLINRLQEKLSERIPVAALFEAPTVEDMARYLGARHAGAAKLDKILPVELSPGESVPLSYAQERLWFLSWLEPESPFYNVPVPLRLSGRLDVPALARSLWEIRRRHSVLRAVFGATADGPVQRIGELLPAALPVVDLSGIGRREAERLAAEEARRPFNLETGPPLRATLLRLAAEEHLLLLTFHHIVTDGWSMGILTRELSAHYTSAPLAEPPIQYSDYARWQSERLSGVVLEEQLAYWRRQLAGAPALLELPTDRPRPAVMRFRGGLVRAGLGPRLTAALAALGRARGATLFMTLAAGYAAVLSRTSGLPDVPMGTIVAGRNRPECEDLIGMFVNTLVLRADLAGDPGFGEVLSRVRRVTVEAFANQDAPFERLVQELRPERNLAHSPLFQVMVMLANRPWKQVELPGLTLGFDQMESGPEPGTSKFDLNLGLVEEDGRLTGSLAFNSDLFDATTAARLIRHLETLLEGAAAHPDRRLSELPLQSAAEHHQALREWNDTAADLLDNPCLHDLFLARAARTPDAPAVVFDGRTLSYGELARRAGWLARRLRALGVRPGVLVAVHLERGPEMVVALLGILQAGGAYVPLSPSFPEERIRVILETMEIGHLVTEDPRPGGLDVDVAATVLLPLREEAGDDGVSPGLSSGPEDLAYIIFTSGSTGVPKGVMVRHRPAVQLVDWVNRTFGIGPSDRVLFVTALSFDLSVYDVFGLLAAGGSLRIASADEVRDPRRLVRILEEEPVTFWDSAPAALQQLVPFLPERAAARLRLVFLSGDWIPVGLPDRVRQAFPRAQVVSLGGATEATVWSNYHVVGEVPPHWTSIPYGRPIANARYHVLDRDLGLCPIGVPGDLYIGGECVSTGYARDPVLTAGKYVPSPFGGGGGEPGARLYRTGDRARHWADGTLEFLGRSDSQVKIRGFRVELGEIEAALAAHPGVREAVVLVRDQRLAACIIPDRRPAPALADLRRFLKTRLPDYMLPSELVVREAWPVTSTGKLDRCALLQDAQAPGPVVEAPPRTALERAIAAVWAEVIGREEIDVRENFFDLGGHSLLLAEVQVRLRETVGRDVPMVDLFRYPTVASLAEFLEGAVEAPEAAPARSRESGGSSIAIVGMAGRFPGASDLEELWSNLCGAVESITFFSREELAAAGIDPALLADPTYVRARGVLQGADLFDAAFFDCPPREAEILDPQHRVFLECCWEALEGAGYVPERCAGRVGVYAGQSENSYAQGLYSDPALVRSMGLYQLSLANKPDYLPSRVSYKLGLKGPSVNVQTACSTSLTAVHMACRALLAGECEMALAGGVSVRFPQVAGYRYEEGSIASPDGHVRAFDAAARGTVGGNGAGVVLLKRLEDALADGDAVRAVILGSAINNDGSSKVGFTAPSVEGQAEVIRQAHQAAGVDPETIRYVEAHGTGTAMGDPIEVAALAEAFRSGTPKRGFCALGTLKGNVGHLDAAAGIAGLLKAALCLERKALPPSLNFTAPNPRIDFDNSPFFVNAALSGWPEGPRRAGVSSFGIGGTNAHAVLEEAPACEPGETSRPAHLLLLSARTPDALDAATERLADHLDRHPEIALADAAYTLQVGRRTFRHRRMLVCSSRDLRSAETATREHAGGPVPVAFLLPGQGAQREGMGDELQAAEPAFREAMDRARQVLGTGLQEVQPALFAVEHALAQVLIEWGIRPQAMLGHSLGEYVAACLAGVFSFEDGLRLVAARGRLMAELPPGGMVAMALPEEGARTLLPGLSLAAVNGPAACTLSGPPEAVAELCRLLASRGVEHRLLRTSHAFHSPAMEPIAGRFADELRRIGLEPPRIPFLSNVTGTWITAAEATDPEYWVRQMLRPVRFAEGAAALLAEDRVLLEVGPGRTLSALAGQQPGARGRVVASSAEPAGLMKAVGRLWLSGAEVDWAAFHGRERRRRVPLPTYPFERRRYWHGQDRPAAPAAAPEPVRRIGKTAGSALEQAVAAVFEELLGVSGVGPGDDFFDLGGSSLMAVQLCARLRQTLGAELPTSVLLEASTVAALAARIAGAGADVLPRPSCRVRLREGGDRRPLFLVHQVGGHVFSFRALARALPAGRPLYGLRSLGLEEGEEPLAGVGDMADLYLDLVREVQPRGPYLLGGASMGGLVALEMARRLRAAAEDVPLLTLMDVPCRDVLPGPPKEEELLAQVSQASDPAEAGRLLRVLRANVGALFDYTPQPYEGPVLFFRARERRPQDPPNPERPWIELAAGGIEIHVVPGDHATMHEPPHVNAMAGRLAGRLASL